MKQTRKRATVNTKWQQASGFVACCFRKWNETEVWMTGDHFQQRLFYVVFVRTSNWNALNVWTCCIEITRTKHWKKTSQVIISRKSAGNILCWPKHGHKFTSHSWHPLCLMHKEMCWTEKQKHHETQDFSDSSAVCFFFCLNSSLANWMTAEKCGMQSSLQPRDPPSPTPPINSWQTDLYIGAGKRGKKKTTGGPKCGLYLQSKLCFSFLK